MNVQLHVDRLVLDGLDVPYGSQTALRVAVERELARLIAGGGLASALAGGIAVPVVAGPTIEAPAPPAQLGAAIAGAVYASVGKAER